MISTRISQMEILEEEEEESLLIGYRFPRTQNMKLVLDMIPLCFFFLWQISRSHHRKVRHRIIEREKEIPLHAWR